MADKFCARCGAPIRFATTTNGKAIALDPGSDPGGCYEFITVAGEHRARFVPELERPMAEHTGVLLFLPHQIDCEKQPTPMPAWAKEEIQKILNRKKERRK